MIINALEYLDLTASRFPNATAIIDADDSITFGELLNRARILASNIIHRDQRHKRPVAVFLPKSAECVTAFLAALYSGNFYVPLDMDWPPARLKKILADLDPAFAITSRQHEDAVRAIMPQPDTIVVIEDALEAATERDDVEIERRVASMVDTDPIYIKYTSGSTGDPKGVVLPHRAVIDYIEWAADTYQLDENEVIGNQAPFTFDVSVQDIYLSLKTGAALVLIPSQHFVFPANLVSYIAEQRISYFCWVPSVLVNVCNMDILAKADTSHLKWVTVLGEIMPTKQFMYWKKHCPNATLVNTYGPTETAIASTFYVLDRDFRDDESLPIGIPCRNTEIMILDDENHSVDAGNLGEICVRGSSLALGYWNDAKKTDDAFAQIPEQTHYPERMYRTGDLGYVNGRGELMFVGRKDSQIKHMGYRIELGEIEAAASSLAEIDRACVLYDDKEKSIILFYEGKAELDRAHLRKALSSQLPKYMLPNACRLVDSFPLNPNGKVDRKKLISEYN